MTLLAVRNLTKTYTGRDGSFTADRDISFSLEKGESAGILGLSGCGKSTLAKMIMGMVPPTSGTILFRDQPVDWRNEAACKTYYGSVQMVFQEALSSFHPLYTVGRSVMKALENYGVAPAAAAERAAAAFAAVGLTEAHLHKRPAELSGGEGQRAGIARALALRPELIVCDEVSSALDTLSQEQVAQVLQKVRRQGTALLLNSHDIAFLERLCDRLLVMDAGCIVEEGKTEAILRHPAVPRTQSLIRMAARLTL